MPSQGLNQATIKIAACERAAVLRFHRVSVLRCPCAAMTRIAICTVKPHFEKPNVHAKWCYTTAAPTPRFDDAIMGRTHPQPFELMDNTVVAMSERDGSNGTRRCNVDGRADPSERSAALQKANQDSPAAARHRPTVDAERRVSRLSSSVRDAGSAQL